MATVDEVLGEMGAFFKQEEIEHKGPLTLTITEFMSEEFKDFTTGEPKMKPVLSFKETNKRLILNKTNTQQLRKVVGGGDPAGKTIKVSFEMTTYVNGKKGPLICLSGVE